MKEDALIQALQDALTENVSNRNGFRTSRELMAELGCTHNKLLDKLHCLKGQGRLETDEVFIENIAGKKQRVPAYRLVSKDVR